MKIRLLLALFAILLIGCDKPQPSSLPPRPALVMTVGDAGDVDSMMLVGEVKPRFESSQSFRIGGKIIERKVDVGAQVKKGQLIARLDAADVKLNAAAAMADVRAAEASHALALAEIERQRQLYAKKFISASALDIKEAELKTSAARLAQVKAQADVSGNQTQYANLTADRDGVVSMIRAEPGQVVEAGEAVVQIANLNETEVMVAVPESRMAAVKVGTPVTVKMWANPNKAYSGRVREIAPAAESATRAFNVRVSVIDADAEIKLGMTAGVKFKALSESQSVQAQPIRIPLAALTENNGRKQVWVIDQDNKAQPREVVAGEFTEDGVLITQGLQAGEKIAIAGVHTLVKGMQVKPVTRAAP